LDDCGKNSISIPAHECPLFDLSGRTAIVTGGSRGLGLQIAEALGEMGARVAISARKQDELDAAVAHLKKQHIDATAQVCDIGKRDAIAPFAEAVLKSFGRVDILVNNAGIQHVSPIETFPPEKYEAIIALNLSAAWYTTRAAFGAMKANGFGRIINVASAHGLVASPFKSAYVAAKHGIVGLTKTVALEGAEHNVTCNAICPGYVWTPLVENQIGDTAKARGITREQVIRDVLLAAQPNKRFAEVDELGALAVFLCGPGGRSITGTALPVDGGWTAH
jgi:3-hydroxybutyrate dehydrogenase